MQQSLLTDASSVKYTTITFRISMQSGLNVRININANAGNSVSFHRVTGLNALSELIPLPLVTYSLDDQNLLIVISPVESSAFLTFNASCVLAANTALSQFYLQSDSDPQVSISVTSGDQRSVSVPNGVLTTIPWG